MVWTLGLSPGLAAQSVPAMNISRDLGLVAANSQGNFCLLIKHGELKPGGQITLIWVPVEGEPNPPEVRRVKIIAKLTAPCNNLNAQTDDHSYRLDANNLDNEKIYIAVVAQPNSLRMGNSQISVRFGNRELNFRACTSMEGVHFSAWSGTPPKEKMVWRRYFYLGYDVEPTCAEREFEEIKP
jgi:hypothetical protein